MCRFLYLNAEFSKGFMVETSVNQGVTGALPLHYADEFVGEARQHEVEHTIVSG